MDYEDPDNVYALFPGIETTPFGHRAERPEPNDEGWSAVPERTIADDPGSGRPSGDECAAAGSVDRYRGTAGRWRVGRARVLALAAIAVLAGGAIGAGHALLSTSRRVPIATSPRPQLATTPSANPTTTPSMLATIGEDVNRATAGIAIEVKAAAKANAAADAKARAKAKARARAVARARATNAPNRQVVVAPLQAKTPPSTTPPTTSAATPTPTQPTFTPTPASTVSPSAGSRSTGSASSGSAGSGSGGGSGGSKSVPAGPTGIGSAGGCNPKCS